MREFSISDLCQLGAQLTHSIGEAVWDQVLLDNNKIIMFQHYWTSQLSNETTWLQLAEWNCNMTWLGQFYEEKELCLYLPKGVGYSIESRTFRQVDSVNENASPMRWSFIRVPSRLSWAAPFVCPFCGTICRGLLGSCEHQLIARGQICSSFREKLPQLAVLCNEICDLTLIGDFCNIQLPGIIVKTSRQPFPRELFRQSFVYAKSTNAAEMFESVVLEHVRFVSSRSAI